MPATALTERQQAVLDYFTAFVREHHVPPSMRDIMGRFGFASPNSAACYVAALIRKGKLRRVGYGKSRAVVPTFIDGCCPFCGGRAS